MPILNTTWNNLEGVHDIASRKAIKTQFNRVIDAVNEQNAALTTGAGVGITNGTGTVYESGITTAGSIVTTRILLDLTGLDSSGTAGDIIGVAAGGAAQLGQFTTAQNGTIFGGRITCLEVPTGGDPDVDFWTADEATGAFDTAISTLTGEVQLVNTGDWTLETDTMTNLPGANQYLYATAGATDDATYTAGKFLIEVYGYA
jgi:hypothetical protein